MNSTTRINFRSTILILFITVLAVYCLAGTCIAQNSEIPGYVRIHLTRVLGDAVQEGDIIQIETIDLDSIATLLEHKNPRLASAAAYALGEIRDEEAVPDLIVALKSDRAHMRRIAAHALGKIGDKRAVPSLIDLLNSEAQPVAVQASAITALGKIGDPDAKHILSRLNRSPEKWLQQTANIALLKISTKEGLMVASAR